MRKKGELPTKLCPVCERPFAWRRKWARDWENVRYCSKGCSGKSGSTRDGGTEQSAGRS